MESSKLFEKAVRNTSGKTIEEVYSEEEEERENKINEDFGEELVMLYEGE